MCAWLWVSSWISLAATADHPVGCRYDGAGFWVWSVVSILKMKYNGSMATGEGSGVKDPELLINISWHGEWHSWRDGERWWRRVPSYERVWKKRDQEPENLRPFFTVQFFRDKIFASPNRRSIRLRHSSLLLGTGEDRDKEPKKVAACVCVVWACERLSCIVYEFPFMQQDEGDHLLSVHAVG